jgi:hypothetical protein
MIVVVVIVDTEINKRVLLFLGHDAEILKQKNILQ